ncbi:hypothetical protein ACWELO_25705 [Streptomyces sp. NPDC004596]
MIELTVDAVGLARRVLRRVAALTQPASTPARGTAQLSPATVSHHLGVLHGAGHLARSRSGRTVLSRHTPAGARLAGRR